MSKPGFALLDMPPLKMDQLEVRHYPGADGETRHVIDLGPIRINLSGAEAGNLAVALLDSCAAVTE